MIPEEGTIVYDVQFLILTAILAKQPELVILVAVVVVLMYLL